MLANPPATYDSCCSTRALYSFLLAIYSYLACQFGLAQQTNPVDRKVSNPMTDTPSVNPLESGSTCSATSAAAKWRAGCQHRSARRSLVKTVCIRTGNCSHLPLRRKRRRSHRHVSAAGRQSNGLRSGEQACRGRQRRFRSSGSAAHHRLARRMELSHQDRLLRDSTGLQTKRRTARVSISRPIASRRSVSTRSSPSTFRSLRAMKTFRSGAFTRARQRSRPAIACASFRQNCD